MKHGHGTTDYLRSSSYDAGICRSLSVDFRERFPQYGVLNTISVIKEPAEGNDRLMSFLRWTSSFCNAKRPRLGAHKRCLFVNTVKMLLEGRPSRVIEEVQNCGNVNTKRPPSLVSASRPGGTFPNTEHEP